MGLPAGIEYSTKMITPAAGRSAAHREFAKTTVVGNENAASSGSQSYGPFVSIALANFFRINHVETARAQALNNEGSDAFVCKEKRHRDLFGGKHAFLGEIVCSIGLGRADACPR